MTMDSGYAEVGPPEPTDDDTPDGTQLPIEDEEGEFDGEGDGQDAGLGDAEIEYDQDPFADNGED